MCVVDNLEKRPNKQRSAVKNCKNKDFHLRPVRVGHNFRRRLRISFAKGGGIGHGFEGYLAERCVICNFVVV